MMSHEQYSVLAIDLEHGKNYCPQAWEEVVYIVIVIS
jgi:hypothetical protein